MKQKLNNWLDKLKEKISDLKQNVNKDTVKQTFNKDVIKQKANKLYSNATEYIKNAKSDEKNRASVVVLISLCINIFVIVFGYFAISLAFFQPVSFIDSRDIEVTIERGTSVTKIGRILKEEGLIRNSTVFKYYVDFSDNSSKIKAGTYTFEKTMTMKEIVKELTKGGISASEVRVTITEGMTVDAIATKLKNSGVISDEESFKKECNDLTNFMEYDFIAALEGKTQNKRYALEGYLYPDTYMFYTDSSNKDAIKRFLDRFEQIMVEEWEQKADEMNLTIDEVVTIASILEQEAKTKDFSKVSAVIHNRLNSNQMLQLCSTVQYAKGITRLALTSEDIAYDSPYNTYKYDGLPPSAICNPGKNALNFALNPDEKYVKDKYLYFCNADPTTGELLFAKTASEHEANVEKYRQLWVKYDEQNEQ